MGCAFKWLRLEYSGGVLWTFESHKRRDISWLAERFSASYERVCSVELVSIRSPKWYSGFLVKCCRHFSFPCMLLALSMGYKPPQCVKLACQRNVTHIWIIWYLMRTLMSYASVLFSLLSRCLFFVRNFELSAFICVCTYVMWDEVSERLSFICALRLTMILPAL